MTADGPLRSSTPSAGVLLRAPAPILSVLNVSKHFGGLDALSDVTLDVRQGEILGVIGPNGAGKTTLFNVITGAFRPDKGSITLNGHDISRSSIQRIVGLGMVRTFQLTSIYPEMTVRENIAVACHLYERPNVFAEVLNLPRTRAARARCDARARELAETCVLGNVLDEIAAKLPYGQKKALSVAIALAVGPSLLLLDEPVAGMNSREIEMILATIERLHRAGITIVVVEHNMRVIMQICDRIAVLHFGRKIAEGAPAQIQRHPAVIAAYLGGMAPATPQDHSQNARVEV